MKANLIENKFIETMELVAASKLTAEEVKNDKVLYNKVAVIAYEFFERVVLKSSRNKSYINSTGIEPMEFIDDVVMHFLKNLDKVIECDSVYRVRFVVMMANNKVVDKVRGWYRMYPVKNKKNNEEKIDMNEIDKNENEETYDVINFLDEITWGTIAAEYDVEMEYENREMSKVVLKALATVTKPLDTIAFLGTILGWKTSDLSEMLITAGLENTLYEILKVTINTYDVDIEMFDEIISASKACNKSYENENSKQLSATLSRCNYNAKEAVKKILRKEM